MKIIIADSSTLIVLLDTDNFSLLFKLFDKIMITQEVYREIYFWPHHKEKIDNDVRLGRLKRMDVEHDDMYEMLRKRLDRGESESIVLAKKLELPLIIDERKGRQIAQSLDIPIIGFIGILLKLLTKGVIFKHQVLKMLKQAEANHFRLSDELKRLIDDFV